MIETYPFPWKFERSRYGEMYLMSQFTEAQVQKDIIELLIAYRVDVVAIDAGGRRQRGRMMAAAKAAGIPLAGVQNVKTGSAIPSGFSDLEATLAPYGRALYIEVKAPAWLAPKGFHIGGPKVMRRAGTPSAEQLDFLLSKHSRGALALVAWSCADVVHYLDEHLRKNREALR